MSIIKATPNHSKRTFTLRKYDGKNILIAKYRTWPMTTIEFNDNEYNTTNDWLNFLKTGTYNLIK